MGVSRGSAPRFFYFSALLVFLGSFSFLPAPLGAAHPARKAPRSCTSAPAAPHASNNGPVCGGGTLVLSSGFTPDWAVRGQGLAAGDGSGLAIAVDNGGSAIVTGYSFTPETNNDYYTVRYDPSGAVEAENVYDNTPVGRDDFARAVALDSFGNAYVTGVSDGAGTGRDYYTAKYDPFGNRLWEQRYSNASPVSNDVGTAIAVDPSGNAIVTGHSRGNSNSADYATVKYDTDGNLLWERRYDGGGNDVPAAVAVDPSGNVFVTGFSQLGDTVDYYTIKYDADGNVAWERSYDNGGEDVAQDVAADMFGNCYVTGYSQGAGGADYYTIRYDPDGNVVWERRYDNGNDDEAAAVAVDLSGNAFVTGYSFRMGDADYYTIGYAPDGAILYERRFDNGWDDRAQAVAVDDAGNAYVTGYSDAGAGNDDYYTIKYDLAGSILWEERYDGGGTDQAKAIAVDAYGNAYVTGLSCGGSDYDIYTIQYASDDLQAQWTGPNGFTSGEFSPSIPNVALADAGLYSVVVSGGGCTSPPGETTVVVSVAPDKAVVIRPVIKQGQVYIELTVEDENDPDNVSGYNLYRSWSPSGGWELRASDAGDSDLVKPGIQLVEDQTGLDSFYYQVVAYNSYCSVEGPR